MDAKTISANEEKNFWEFSVNLYTRPGVERACLGLQDRFGLNVNLILFCDFLGFSGRGRLDAADIAIATVACSHWHSSVVEPLRAARRVADALADKEADVKKFRRQLLHDELAAERLEQTRIARSCTRVVDTSLSVGSRCADTVANLYAYQESTKVQLDAAGRKMFADLVAATYAELPRAKITRLTNKVFL